MTAHDVRSRDRRFIAGIAAFITVLFASVLTNSATFYRGDLFLYHLPMKRVVRDAIFSGEFPWWTRSLANGQPLAANPAWELFYPPQWLILLPDYRLGFGLHIVVHLYAAAIGMFLFLRRLSLAPTAAAFGSVSFALGGFLLGASSTLPTFFVWSLAPLLFWALLGLLQEWTGWRFLAASCVAGLQLLVAEPTSTLQVWMLAAVGAVLYARGNDASRRSLIGSLAALLAVAIASLLLSSVQILPAADHAMDSVRSRGFSYHEATRFSLTPERPLELIAPHLYGFTDPARASFWGAARFGRRSPYFPSFYCGLALATLALTGLFMRHSGWVPALTVFAGAYVVSLGDATPVYRLLYAAGMRGLRYPEKFFATAVFVVIVFAASVAHSLARGDERTRVIALRVSTAILALVVLLAAPSLLPDYPERFARLWQIAEPVAETAAVASSARWREVPIAVGLVALLLLRKRVSTRAWSTLAALFLVIDLAPRSLDAAPRISREFFEPPSAVGALPAGSRMFNRSDWVPLSSEDVAAAGPYRHWVGRNFLRLYSPLTWRLDLTLPGDFDETQLLPTHELLDTMMRVGKRTEAWSTPFAVITSTTHVVDRGDAAQALLRARGDVAAAAPVVIRRVPSQPLVYFATKLVAATRPGAAEQYLASNPVPFATALTIVDADAAAGSVQVLHDSPSRVVVRTNSGARGFLVFTQTRHKYWRATVDRYETPVVPANIAFQGIFLAPGAHTVVFRYENPLVIAGAAITLCTLFLLTSYGVLDARRRAA